MISSKPQIELRGRYSITEAARALMVDRKTLYRYRDNGDITVNYRKINSRPFIYGSELIKVWNAKY
jgi:predicted site-specific integrase-resolvase